MVISPIIVVAIVFLMTKNEPKSYKTNASVYTGIATGSSIVSLEESKMDLFGTRTAFDNLINIITSRSTLEEVGLRLLASHLLLEHPSNEIIEKQSYNELMKIVPPEVKALVVKGDFKRTLKNLKKFKDTDHENFIYEFIHYSHRHYSSKGIRSNTKVTRVQSSDLIEIQFTSDDPGICKQTLDILIEVFIEEYSGIKVNQSDAVVKYFQVQIDDANERLNQAENELLQFNRSNNIVNYYEQTKHIASEKEHANLTYMEIQMENAAAISAMKALENKMSEHEKTILNSAEIMNLRNQLAKVNLEIALKSNADKLDAAKEKNLISELSALQTQSFQLQQTLNNAITQKYSLENTPEGVSSGDVLNEWLNKMIEHETTKAKLTVGNQKQNEFRQLFSDYAPLGATMKRLERKIDVAEREYLALLQSLNLAKLKQQNIELNSNLKIVAAPFFPIVAEPSKRKMLLVLAFLIGFLIPAFTIIALEFLDQNIRNTFRAENFIGLKVAAIFPVLRLDKGIDVEYVKNRGLDIVSRRLILNTEAAIEKPKPDINLVFSVLKGEGKSLLIESLVEKLSEFGYKVLLLKPKISDEFTFNAPNILFYNISHSFHRVSTISELDADWSGVDLADYDYVFVEIPGILNNTYPIKLFKSSHHSFLVTRANRPWSKADKNAIKDIVEFTKKNNPQLLLNGVPIEEMESVIGDLPRHRSFIRRLIKNMLRLQFFSKKNLGTHYEKPITDENQHRSPFSVKWIVLATALILVAAAGYLVVYPKYKDQKAKQTETKLIEGFHQTIDNGDTLVEESIIKKAPQVEEPANKTTRPQNAVRHLVVAGVFRSNENARQCYNLHKQFGFEPTIVEVNGGLFRVVIGSYNTRDEAERIRKEVNDFVPNADASIVLTTETSE